MLRTDRLHSVNDEASVQAKAVAQAEVARAIEKELGSALQKEVVEATKKLRKGNGKKNKVLNTTHIAGGGVHGFKVREAARPLYRAPCPSRPGWPGTPALLAPTPPWPRASAPVGS